MVDDSIGNRWRGKYRSDLICFLQSGRTMGGSDSVSFLLFLEIWYF